MRTYDKWLAPAVVCLWLMIGTVASAGDGGRIDYITDVKPILTRRCAACHGALKQEGALRLDAVQLIRAGGELGPAVLAGRPDESPLLQAVTGTGDMRRMPL